MRSALAASVVLTVAIKAAVFGIQADRTVVQPSPFRTTEVRATVLRVERLSYPEVHLSLRVEESSRASVLSASGGAIGVACRNYLRMRNSKVDFDDHRNIGSIGGYYLLQGDKIRGKLFAGSRATVGDREWLIYDIERIGVAAEKARVRSAKARGDLLVVLEADKPAYDAGESVKLSLSIENVGDRRQTIRFASGQHYDFMVTAQGRDIWRWSADKAFVQMLTQLELAPGEKETFTADWPQMDDQGAKVEPGTYEIGAVLTASGDMRLAVGPVTVMIRQAD